MLQAECCVQSQTPGAKWMMKSKQVSLCFHMFVIFNGKLGHSVTHDSILQGGSV